MHTVQSIVLPKSISLLCLSNYRITFPRCQVRKNVTPSSFCILSRVCAIARAVCMLTTVCATACRQPLQPSSLSWDPTMLRTIATCFKPCGPIIRLTSYRYAMHRLHENPSQIQNSSQARYKLLAKVKVSRNLGLNSCISSAQAGQYAR